MAKAGWIPRADGAFRTFAVSFVTNISADPARYMVVPAEAQALQQHLARFIEALAVSSNNKTRTGPAIVNKDDARSILDNSIRQTAAFIRPNLGIVDGDKIGIGVRPINPSRRERKCPTTAPLLKYIGSLPGIDELRFSDSNTPTSKSKPYGAERLELWVSYNPEAPMRRQPPDDAQLVGSFKKSKMLVEQDRSRDVRLEGSSKPTYWARWVGFNGDVGPWSVTLSLGAAAEAARNERQAKKQREADTAGENDQSLRIAA